MATATKSTRKLPSIKPDLKGYFRQLENKGIRPEDVASDLKRSFSTIMAWKSGRSRPDFVVIQVLERNYGVKVA